VALVIRLALLAHPNQGGLARQTLVPLVAYLEVEIQRRRVEDLEEGLVKPRLPRQVSVRLPRAPVDYLVNQKLLLLVVLRPDSVVQQIQALHLDHQQVHSELLLPLR
jgi:hypothetical protein